MAFDSFLFLRSSAVVRGIIRAFCIYEYMEVVRKRKANVSDTKEPNETICIVEVMGRLALPPQSGRPSLIQERRFYFF